jgi:hypothetical protein
MPGLSKFIIGCFVLSAAVCVSVDAQAKYLRKQSRRFDPYWANQWVDNMDEAEDGHNVGDSYWAKRWIDNMDAAEADHNVGDSYWAKRWIDNIDEAEADHNVGDSYWAKRWIDNIDEANDEAVGSYTVRYPRNHRYHVRRREEAARKKVCATKGPQFVWANGGCRDCARWPLMAAEIGCPSQYWG